MPLEVITGRLPLLARLATAFSETVVGVANAADERHAAKAATKLNVFILNEDSLI